MSEHSPIDRWLGSLLVGILVASCSSSPTSPTTPSITITGVTVTATPNPAQLTVTVQASAVVMPAAAPQTVTWSSSNNALATVNASGLVSLLSRGTVTITATSTAAPARSGSVTLTIICPDPRLVTADLTADTTWENWIADPGCFDYVVQATVSLEAQLLTIEPGTVVGFEEGIALRVLGAAGLNAEGTADQPIKLTGTTEERGFWKGVSFANTQHPDNVIAHTTIEYTGGAAFGNVEDASLILIDNVVIRIENSTFRQSAGYGMTLDRQADVSGVGGNTLTENALGPAWAHGSEVKHLINSTLTGNDVDVVVVNPNGIVDDDASWPNAVYHILRATSPESFNVLRGSLTLSPGTELRFEADQSLLFTAGSGLSAVGTAAAPIVFTGTQAVPGHWGGLGFVDTDNAMNRLDHVVIEYGGGRHIGGGHTEPANLVVTHGTTVESRVTVSNTTLRGSATYGLYARFGSKLEGFENNSLTANDVGPAYVDASVVGHLLSSNSYVGNGTDEVTVRNGNIIEPATWLDLGVPYFLTTEFGAVTPVNAPLTIAPGVEILADAGAGLSMVDGGSLTAEGTQMNRITMRGKQGVSWRGLQFAGANGSFDYIDIMDGGSHQWAGVLEPGTITIIAPATVNLTGEVTLAGAGFGIVFSYGASIAVGCPGSVYIPPFDTFAEHCRPP